MIRKLNCACCKTHFHPNENHTISLPTRLFWWWTHDVKCSKCGAWTCFTRKKLQDAGVV